MFGLFKSKSNSVHAKILIVDDEPDYLSTVKCRLEWCRYEVVTAADGQEGLQIAASEKPDLILLDTNMPIMNGHEMLDRLKKNPDLKDIPVIMVTALCEVQDIATASSYGVVDYVAKPFDFAQLMEKIAEILENNKALNKV